MYTRLVGLGLRMGGLEQTLPQCGGSPLTEAAPPIGVHLVLWMAATLWAFSRVLTGVLAPTVSMVTGH